MLDTHPHPSSHPADIVRCSEACFACLAACHACADACLSEPKVERLTDCIRLNLDCADVCAATGAVVLRIGRAGPQPLQAQLAACAQACRTCAEECRRHAAMHAHCRICAEACEACYRACEEMMVSMRHAGESESSTH
ncbi:MAG: four-helix bundle copper-binding protein [Variibacter sp.]|nr:four-helix bundle copper-binding protein [Variibacter sp.]